MRPIIDVIATGANICRLRKRRRITVSHIQENLELASPRVIYKWQSGECLPTIENLLGLSIMFGVSINDIIKTA